MTWAAPQWLWALLLPLTVPLLRAWRLRSRSRRSNALTGPQVIWTSTHSWTSHSPLLVLQTFYPLLTLGLMAGVLALARPQWGTEWQIVRGESRNVLIALDVSHSMMAPDVSPTRLDRAKTLILSLLDDLAGEQVGLILFAGTAYVHSPLSPDTSVLRGMLPSITPGIIPHGGTNYSAMLQEALHALDPSNGADTFLIILSDGEAHDDGWKDLAQELIDRGVSIIALGVGTPQGSILPDGSGGFLKDERGAAILSRLEPATLQTLAEMSHGSYRQADQWVDLSALLAETVQRGRAARFEEEARLQHTERFQIFLAAAMLLLWLSLWLELPVTPRARTMRTLPTIMSVGIISLIGPLPLIASTPPPQALMPSLPPTLARAIEKAAGSSRRTAHTYADVVRASLEAADAWKAAGTPTPASVIRDALEAVHAGETLDPQAAPWEEWRKALLDHLEPPPQNDAPPPPPQPGSSDQEKSDPNHQNNDSSPNPDSSPPPDSGDSSSSSPQTSPEGSTQPDAPDPTSPSPPQETQDGDRNQTQTQDNAGSTPDPSDPQPQNAERQSPDTPAGETSKVSRTGDQKKEDVLSPTQAAALIEARATMERLRQQDMTAELFQRMNQNESPNTAPPRGKNW